MRKFIYLAISSFLLFTCCGTNTKQNQDAGVFIHEPTNPQVVTLSRDWNQLKHGIHAAWGSTHTRYLKDYIPQNLKKDELELVGWKNERVQAQLVLWSGDTIENIDVNIQLTGADGEKFPENSIKNFYLRNVISDEFLKGCKLEF